MVNAAFGRQIEGGEKRAQPVHRLNGDFGKRKLGNGACGGETAGMSGAQRLHTLWAQLPRMPGRRSLLTRAQSSAS